MNTAAANDGASRHYIMLLGGAALVLIALHLAGFRALVVV